MKRSAGAVLACALISGAAVCATVEYRPSIPHTRGAGIILDGQIAAGDANRLLDVLRDKRSMFDSTLFVNSPGGSVDEAMKIAKVVQAMYMSVFVLRGGSCASACFFVFLAGSGRVAAAAHSMTPEERRTFVENVGHPPEGDVGLHRPSYEKLDSLANQQSQGMRSVAAYLESQMLSRRLIDVMMTRPSNDIYWLTQEDLDEIGEYPPDQEEFLIRKCGYDRRSLHKAFEARIQGDADRAMKLMSAHDLERNCAVNEIGAMHGRAVKTLRAGKLNF